MFSSDNNSYPLFYHHQSPSFTNVTPESSNNTFFQHHYYDHGNHNSNYILPLTPTFSLIQENPIVKLSSEPSINQQNSMLCPSNMKNVMPSSKRAPGKKDRHTKISTAQGVRDRRVRLSMNIARDFFNLQDMLGFDKASKTLGWLMAKSKAAIDELINTSNKQNQETSTEDTNNEEVDDEKISLDAKSLSNKKRNRRENNLNGRNVSMEMKRREEARNRARERTRNKKFVDDQNNQLPQHQSSVQQDWTAYQSSSTTTAPCTFPYEIVSEGVSSKDNQETCNYSNVYLSKSTSESCTYGGFPEIHINARTWDAYNNQLMH